MNTNFKYELNQNIQEMQGPLPGGIHEDVELVSIRFEDLSQNNPIRVLRFIFNKGGLQFRYTELPINEEAISRWNFRKSTYEETLTRKYRELGERLKHIYTALTGETRVKLESNTWEEFCKEYIDLAGNKFQDKKFAIKVVYNDKGYTTFPDRAFNPFIVPSEHAGRLKIDPQHDRINSPQHQESRDEVADEYYPSGVLDSASVDDEEMTF